MGTMPRRTPPASIRVKHYTSAPSPEVFAAGASRPSGPNPYAAASGQGASASTPPQRKPWLLLIKSGEVTPFAGQSIPGIVAVVGRHYEKSGKW